MNWKSTIGKEIIIYVINLRKQNYKWEDCAKHVWEKFSIVLNGEILRKQCSKFNGEIVEDLNDSRKPDIPIPADRVTDVSSGNDREVTLNTPEIKTLDNLIDECKIDLAQWSVYKHVINYWGNPGYRNFQVKAWLNKINPDQVIFPDIKKISFSIPSRNEKTTVPILGIHKCVVIPDSQVGFTRDMKYGTLEPYHDRKAMQVVLQIVDHVKPDIIVLLGDMLDLPDWSTKYIRTPEMYFTTQPSIIELGWFLSQLRISTPTAGIYYLEGNHEARMPKNIITNLISAYNIHGICDNNTPVLSIPNLLGLNELDIHYVGDYPNGQVWLNNDLVCIHGDKAKVQSGDTVREILKDTHVSIIAGHVHRFEYACKTLFGPDGHKVIKGFSPGTLAKINGNIPAVKKRNNWQQGMGVVEYNDTVSNIIPIEISEGACVYDGHIFTGIDYKEKLIGDTKWQF